MTDQDVAALQSRLVDACKAAAVCISSRENPYDDSEGQPRRRETAPGCLALCATCSAPSPVTGRLAVALIVPSVLAVGVFVYGFIGWSALVSVSKWNTVRPDYTYVGLDNFRTSSTTSASRSISGTRSSSRRSSSERVSSSALCWPRCWTGSIKGEGIFRSIYLFPMAVSFIVTGVVWRWLLAPRAGVNLLTEKAGLGRSTTAGTRTRRSTSPSDSRFADVLHWVGLGFLADPNFGIPMAMISVVIAATWQMSGFVLVMYLAGLRAIPEELREAARVDGASELQILRHISLPLLRPVTLSAMIILGHQSLKIFDLVVSMTQARSGLRHRRPRTVHVRDDVPGEPLRTGAPRSPSSCSLPSASSWCRTSSGACGGRRACDHSPGPAWPSTRCSCCSPCST